MIPAVLRADELVDLYAKSSGYVATISVDIGSRVRKGDVLLTISVPELAAESAYAEATLSAKRAKAAQARSLLEAARAEEGRSTAEDELQRITAKRKEDLFKRQAIPQQEWDEARSRLAISQAELKNAAAKIASSEGDIQIADAEVKMAEAKCDEIRSILDYTRLVAPFDGVITRRMVDVGAFVRSAAQGVTTPLFTLAKTDPLRLVLDIPEADSARVRVGSDVLFQVKSLGDQKFPARISRTSLALRSDSRTMQAEADIANADGRFVPGMYAQASIQLVADRAATAPADAASATSRPLSR